MKKNLVIALFLILTSSVSRADDTNLGKMTYETAIAQHCYSFIFKEDKIASYSANTGSLIPFSRYLQVTEEMMEIEDLTRWYQNALLPIFDVILATYPINDLIDQNDPRVMVPWDKGADEFFERTNENIGEALYYCAKTAKFLEGFMVGHMSQQ